MSGVTVAVLIGRDFKKAMSQTWAYVAFRWMAIWLLILACALQGKAGQVAALVIVAADIIAQGLARGVGILHHENQSKDWMDRLTNRFFYRHLIEAVQEGRFREVDVDELVDRAQKSAVADINRAHDASVDDSGLFGTTGWQWFGGLLSFLWHWISFALYYGSALYLGSSVQH